MPLPKPYPGLVINYAYLWHEEYATGLEEGHKDRPSVIILATKEEDGETIVTVAPVTHSPPQNPQEAIEIPLPTKQRLRLDSDRSWLMCGEINRFVWPGPDLRQIPGRAGEVAYGDLPARLFQQIKERVVQLATARRIRVVVRS